MSDKPLCKNCEYWGGSKVLNKRFCLAPLAEGQTFVSFSGYSSAFDGCSRYVKKKGKETKTCLAAYTRGRGYW